MADYFLQDQKQNISAVPFIFQEGPSPFSELIWLAQVA